MSPITGTDSLLAIDQNIASALGRLIPATNESRLGFQPSSDERQRIAQIRDKGIQLSTVIQQITDYDTANAADKGLTLQSQTAEPLSKSIEALALGLINSTLSQTQSLKADNASAFDQSQALFIAVAAVATILALLLGYVLSWLVLQKENPDPMELKNLI